MIKITSVILSVLCLSFALNAAPAKKVCNELKVSQCNKREDCNWIKKSKDKNGKEKKAYCRKKAASKKSK